jgi:hypothetical protein
MSYLMLASINRLASAIAGWRPVHCAASPLGDYALGQAGPQGGPGRCPWAQLPARTGEQIVSGSYTFVCAQKRGSEAP